MDINGQILAHHTYGQGIVTAFDGRTVTVCFAQGEKTFLFPDAFARHLRLKDDTLQRSVQTLLTTRTRERDEALRLHAQQARHQLRLRDYRPLKNGHAVFDLGQPDTLERWQASTGVYAAGPARGLPRRAERLRPNSACLLTALPAGASESERQLLGLFMVRPDFFGDLCPDGTVESHPQHRLRPAEPIPLWSVLEEEPPRRWGAVPFRYISTEAVERLLERLAEDAAGDEARSAAVSGLRQYFRRLNRLPAPADGRL